MTTKVYWINRRGQLMESNGTNMPVDVTGIVRSETMSLADAKKKYPEYFKTITEENNEQTVKP